jgi:hypothetical protein
MLLFLARHHYVPCREALRIVQWSLKKESLSGFGEKFVRSYYFSFAVGPGGSRRFLDPGHSSDTVSVQSPTKLRCT